MLRESDCNVYDLDADLVKVDWADEIIETPIENTGEKSVEIKENAKEVDATEPTSQDNHYSLDDFAMSATESPEPPAIHVETTQTLQNPQNHDHFLVQAYQTSIATWNSLLYTLSLVFPGMLESLKRVAMDQDVQVFSIYLGILAVLIMYDFTSVKPVTLSMPVMNSPQCFPGEASNWTLKSTCQNDFYNLFRRPVEIQESLCDRVSLLFQQKGFTSNSFCSSIDQVHETAMDVTSKLSKSLSPYQDVVHQVVESQWKRSKVIVRKASSRVKSLLDWMDKPQKRTLYQRIFAKPKKRNLKESVRHLLSRLKFF